MNIDIYTCIDFECTCWPKGEHSREEMEVIEIGAVSLDSQGQVLGEFQSFIRPHLYPILSEFCTKLTGLTQEQINTAPKFSEAYLEFVAWLAEIRDNLSKRNSAEWTSTLPFFQETRRLPSNITMVSWGQFDWTQLGRECRRLYAPLPFSTHINLKVFFKEMYNIKRSASGLYRTASRFGIYPQEGMLHRGLNDAKMVAQILQSMWKEGFYVQM